ncbi:MAG: Hsp20/alpha crystallin family protein [Pseudonocardiaceae bacterium]
MAIAVRHNVWSPFDSQFDALIRRAFGTPALQARSYVPAADVRTEDGSIVIKLELPGVDTGSEISIQLAGRQLVVSGHRATDRSDERNGFMVREIRSGSFRRAFTLPAGVTAEQISADYAAGLLTVHVRDAIKPAPQVVTVPVRGLSPAQEDTPTVDAGTADDAKAEQA